MQSPLHVYRYSYRTSAYTFEMGQVSNHKYFSLYVEYFLIFYDFFIQI
jgi:hypothetical protein